MGLAQRPKPFDDSLQTPVVSRPVFIDNRIPLGLRDEYVTVGDHIAYFWETSGEFREAVGFLEVGLDRGEFCMIFGHTEGNRRVCRLPLIWSVKDVAIDPTAAQRNQSEGTLAVCCSIIFATGPSVCVGSLLSWSCVLL